jgi:hypothetical protein
MRIGSSLSLSIKGILIELLRIEGISLFDEFGAKLTVVLDDAVMDDGKTSTLGKVRMAVHLRDASVCRPASMTDPDMIRREIIGIGLELQVRDLPDGFHDLDRSLMVHDTYTGTIIATIFESTESGDYFSSGTPLTSEVSEDSTHRKK